MQQKYILGSSLFLDFSWFLSRDSERE